MNITDEYILSLLAGSSRDNPVKRSTIEDKLSVSKRKAEKIIEKMRRNHIPIGSTSAHSGYFLMQTEQDRKAHYKDCSSRIKSQIITLAATLDVEPGQMVIDLLRE